MKRTSVLAVAAFAAFAAVASIAIGLVIDEATLARSMTHPVRAAADGSPPAATIAAAMWLRWALFVGGPIAAALLAVAALQQSAARSSEPASLSKVPVGRVGLYGAAGILVGGLALRSILLDQSLWYDELVGFGAYSLHGPWVVIGNYFSQANHVASQLAIWASTSFLGVDEYSMRLPSLLASLATIAAGFGLGREIDRARSGDRHGLLGHLVALVLAAAPLAVVAGTDARGYSFVIAGATIAFWLALRGRRTLEAWTWIGLALALAIATWAHLVAGVLIAAFAAWALVDALRGDLEHRRAGRAAFVAACAGGVLAAALYAPIVPDLLAVREQFQRTVEGQPLFLGPETMHALLGLGGSWVAWAAIPGFVLGLVAIATGAVRGAARAVVVVAFGAALATYGAAIVADSWLYARFVVFTLPGTAVLVALGIDELLARSRVLGCAATLAFVGAATISVATLPPRQPLRDAVALAAESRTSPSESIAVLGLRDNPTLFYAMAERVDLVDLGDRGAFLDERLGALPPARRPHAIIVLYPTSLDPARTAELAALGYRKTAELPGWIDWGAGRVDIWQR